LGKIVVDQRIENTSSGQAASLQQDKREAIIAAATALFLRKGYEETTIADIAEDAGVAVGSIYRHVADKVSLLEEVRTHLADGIATVMRAALQAPGEEKARIEAMVDAVFQAVRHEPKVLRFLLLPPREVANASDDRPSTDPIALALEAGLAQRVRNGRILASTARSVARLGHGMVLAALMHDEPEALKTALANLFAAAA
jgi:AcrR family transcriptional regulator